MTSTHITETQILPPLPVSRPDSINGNDGDDYRYETFRAGVLMNDARFSPDALKPGQLLPDQTLVRPDGEEISLRNLAAGRPIVLVTGSLTCPLSISSLPAFAQLNRTYGERVAFAFIYTREAHPGESLGQPSTLEEKMEHARQLQEVHRVDWPVLVDDLDGTVHRKLDTKQNSVHIADAEGRVVFRALFAGSNAVGKAIAAVAETGQPHKSQIHGMLTGSMRSIGYIDETLRLAGSKAYRDVIKALPPMAAVALMARAFPFLPKANRGWAAISVMLGAVAALWLAFR